MQRKISLMHLRRNAIGSLALTLALAGLTPAAHGQDPGRRGRKYKSPPPTSHIEVEVLRSTNQKPIANAAVIFHSIRDGKDEGNLEVKTNENGKAMIDIISTGSNVDVQVIADGFATFAERYLVTEPTRQIQIAMLPPRAQISTYEETHGQASQRSWGVQEPVKPSSAPVIQTPKPTNHTSDPNPISPVSPNATPGNSQNNTTIGKPSGVPPQL